MNSILFVGVVTLAFSLASLIGVNEQEAFQIQDNAATRFLCFDLHDVIRDSAVCHEDVSGPGRRGG